MNDEPQLICVLCGMIVLPRAQWPFRCVANGGADHVPPESPMAAKVIEIRKRWLAGLGDE